MNIVFISSYTLTKVMCKKGGLKDIISGTTVVS